MGKHGRGRHRGQSTAAQLIFLLRRFLELVIWLSVWMAFAWATLPGLGPDLVNLQARGWPAVMDSDPLQDFSNLPPTPLTQAFLTLQIRSHTNPPPPPYHREEFGSGWADTDGNGCDTRRDILRRDLRYRTEQTLSGDSCVMDSGWLFDPYSGNPIHYRRGRGTSNLVQIDHVVALRDAWDSGAWRWTAQQRLDYANDPLVLLAVSGWTNRDKGAAHAGQWLPPNSAFHCAYAARQVAIKHRYKLSVTVAELNALGEVISGCPETELPG